MRTKDGLFIGASRTFGQSGPSKHTWVIASRHYPWSITWSWVIYWTKPGLVPLWRWILGGCGFCFMRQDVMPYTAEQMAEWGKP